MRCVSNCNRNNSCNTRTIRALINTVLDSCCKFDEIQKDVIVPISRDCDTSNLKLGRRLTIEIDGDVNATEVNREEINGTCLSTVLTRYPVKFLDPCASTCECDPDFIKQVFTSLHTVSLSCTPYSELDTQNSRVVALSAIITHIGCDYVAVSIVVSARICLRQTVMQEHAITVSPVSTELCESRVRPDTSCQNCSGTATEEPVQVAVPNSGSSGFFL